MAGVVLGGSKRKLKKKTTFKRYTTKNLPPSYLKLLYVAAENGGKTVLATSLCELEPSGKTILIGTETYSQYEESLKLFEEYDIELIVISSLEELEDAVKEIEDRITAGDNITGIAVDNITDIWDYHIKKRADELKKEKMHFLDYAKPNVWHMQLIFRIVDLPVNIVLTGNIKPIYKKAADKLLAEETGENTHNINKKVWKKLPNRLELLAVEEKDGNPLFRAVLTKNKIDRTKEVTFVNPLANDVVIALEDLRKKKKGKVVKKNLKKE